MLTFASTEQKVQLKMMGMSLVLQIFGHKPNYWTNYKVDNGATSKVRESPKLLKFILRGT